MSSTNTVTYRSENGQHLFSFEFVQRNTHVEIFCHRRPDLDGKDPDAHKTHIFSNNQICFYKSTRPKSMDEARRRAKEWAEYYLEYRRTGVPQ